MLSHAKTAFVSLEGQEHRSLRGWRVLLAIAGLVCLAPLLVPVLTPRDGRFFMYPYGASLQFAPMICCFLLARKHLGIAKAQWLLLSGHFAMLALSLTAPSLMLWAGWPREQVSSWLISGFSASSSMFCLLSFSIFEGGSGWSKRCLDTVMALILCSINFFSAFSRGPSGFSKYHLQVVMATAIFLLCVAEASRRSAAYSSQRLFTEITTAYFASRVVMLFFVNIVDAVWLAPARELPFDLLWGIPPLLFSLMGIYSLTFETKRKRVTKPGIFWSNLLPSMILLATVAFALHGFTTQPILYGLGILLSVVCFVLRTHLLYQRLLNEQMSLLVRTGQLETLVTRDTLTGIGNRKWLEDVALELLTRKPPVPVALLLIDTDGFKQINDTFGHLAGDELLREIGEELREQTHDIEGSCCARIGGDEFAVLLPGLDPEAAVQIAEVVREKIQTFHPEGITARCSVSIGVSMSSSGGSLSGLLELADKALYRAKRGGRNAVEISSEDAGGFVAPGEPVEKRRYREQT